MACVYHGCEQRYQTFTSTNFFYLPNDNRRDIWIQNSGNSKLKMVPPSKKVRFCEAHFDPKYFRRQFNRTILRRDAVPYNYYEMDECSRNKNTPLKSINVFQENNSKTINQDEDPIELVTVVDLSNLLDIDNQEQFSNETHLHQDYLQEQTELVEVMEPIQEEIVNIEVEKIFADSATQTEDQALKIGRAYIPSSVYDEDEHFILSLLGPLRRLPESMKISARLSILEIIARCESQTK